MSKVALSESWQAYSLTGEPSPTPLPREEGLHGVLHGAAHIWLWRLGNGRLEALLQKRAVDKLTFPGKWDVSAAGHLRHGETPVQAACRETAEELGITPMETQCELIFVHRQYMATGDEKPIIENELQFVYGIKISSPVDFDLQAEEVESVKWTTMADIKAMIVAGEVVPHGEVYFTELFNQLDRCASIGY